MKVSAKEKRIKEVEKSIGVNCQTGNSPTPPWYYVGSQEREILTEEDGLSTRVSLSSIASFCLT